MTVPEAALTASGIIAILVVALLIGRALGRLILRIVNNRSRHECRSTDWTRAADITKKADLAYQAARDTRLTAEALERHLHGAAHV